MFFKKLIFFLQLPIIFAIIFPPPDPEIFEIEIVKDFNNWRALRNQFFNLTDHKFGWPDFTCNDDLNIGEHPTNVHQLTPGDIGVIAALGDSLTVGEAAESATLSGLTKSYPGVNFVTGGDVRLDQQATLFNLFHQYNVKLRGASSTRIRKFYDFNLAVPGESSNQLLNQTHNLINRLRSRLTHEELQNTWKFINIFIGHNDFCQICSSTNYTFGKSIQQSLVLLKSNIPRVFVNIMPPINVYIHTELHEKSRFCEKVHRQTCPCIFQLNDVEYDVIKARYDEELEQVIKNFDRNDTFEVVLAPAVDLTEIPRIQNSPNLAIVALDCFHFSTISHDISAKQIWKGLFQYINHKEATDFEKEDFGKVKCPPKQCPYLRTPKNSLNCQYTLAKSLMVDGVGGEGEGSSGLTLVFMVMMFIVGTMLILLFIRHQLSPPSSHQFTDERRRLLPTDLNDNIF